MVKTMKFFILLTCLVLGAKAKQIEVEALKFYSDENSGKSILSGNVVIKQNQDILNSEEVVIFTDKNRKPIRYEASKNAHFSIVLKGKSYKGSGDKFIYNTIEDVYTIEGNAFIHEIQSDKKLYGDKIIVDRKNNIYRVESNKQKPARFVFDMEEK